MIFLCELLVGLYDFFPHSTEQMNIYGELFSNVWISFLYRKIHFNRFKLIYYEIESILHTVVFFLKFVSLLKYYTLLAKIFESFSELVLVACPILCATILFYNLL